MTHFKSFLLLFSIFFLGTALAQNGQKKPKKLVYAGETFLAGGEIGNGTITKEQLDALIKLPLVSRDSLGRLQPVVNFKITWAELGLYEDSTGRPLILADYYEAFSGEKHTVPQPWLDMILKRSKPGDTLTFSHITAMIPLPVVALDTTASGIDSSSSLSVQDREQEVDQVDSTNKKPTPFYYRSRELQLVITE